jgi:SAM-dependent methyltransferase
MTSDVWSVGDAYEAYVGRWSRRVAETFVRWLAVPAGRRWLDVGCGTGALTHTVRATATPSLTVGIDPSVGFLRSAAATGPVCAGDARALPVADGSFDAVVSGLALNFVPHPDRAVVEFARVAAADAVVAAYVWDYAEGMAMMRHFWAAVSTMDSNGPGLDEALRFPICRPEPLQQLWADAGLRQIHVQAIDIPTRFASFDDYWTPFLGGQGPAPTYVASLSDDRRAALRDLLRSRLPVGPDGAIALTARAWAVRGTR